MPRIFLRCTNWYTYEAARSHDLINLVEPVVEIGSGPPDEGVHVEQVNGGDSGNSDRAFAKPGAEMKQEAAIDPICGMSVDPATADYRSVHDGKTYYFCSRGCKERFDKDPGGFVSAKDTGRSSA